MFCRAWSRKPLQQVSQPNQSCPHSRPCHQFPWDNAHSLNWFQNWNFSLDSEHQWEWAFWTLHPATILSGPGSVVGLLTDNASIYIGSSLNISLIPLTIRQCISREGCRNCGNLTPRFCWSLTVLESVSLWYLPRFRVKLGLEWAAFHLKSPPRPNCSLCIYGKILHIHALKVNPLFRYCIGYLALFVQYSKVKSVLTCNHTLIKLRES